MPKSRKRASGKNKAGTAVSGAAAAGGTKATSKPAEKAGLIQYIAQTRQEARKVTWTGSRETITTTILVFIVVILFGLFFFVLDFFLGTGTKMFLEFFGAGGSSGPAL